MFSSDFPACEDIGFRRANGFTAGGPPVALAGRSPQRRLSRRPIRHHPLGAPGDAEGGLGRPRRSRRECRGPRLAQRDRVPGDNAGFLLGPGSSLGAEGGVPAANGVDLLSVVMHEIGHLLGECGSPPDRKCPANRVASLYSRKGRSCLRRVTRATCAHVAGRQRSVRALP